MGRKTRKNKAARKGSAQEPRNSRYSKECDRGEKLLLAGRPGEAAQIFEAVLAAPGLPGFERTVVLGRLGHCLHITGSPDRSLLLLREGVSLAAQLAHSDAVQALKLVLQAKLGDVLRDTGQYADARQAYQATLALSEDLNDFNGQALAHSQLGNLAFLRGEPEDALAHSRAALTLSEKISDPVLEAVTHQQLGCIFHKQRQWDEAERHYKDALANRETAGDRAGVVQLWSQLALLSNDADRPDAAEGWYRKTIEWYCRTGEWGNLGRQIGTFSAFLRDRPARLAQTRLLLEQGIAQHSGDPTAADSWSIYGILANLIEMEVAASSEGTPTTSLQNQASLFRQVERYAPKFIWALDQLDDDCTTARAVLSGRLARCLEIVGRVDLAIPRLQDALSLIEKLEHSEDVEGLQGMLYAHLGDAYVSNGKRAEAKNAYEAALRSSKHLKDIYGESQIRSRLGACALLEDKQAEAFESYQEALALLQKFDEPALESMTRHQLARIAGKRRDWDDAEHHYRESVRLRKTVGDRVGAAHIWQEFALLCKDADRPEPSEQPLCIAEPGGATVAADSPGVDVSLHDEIKTEYALEPDLLLDGWRENRITTRMQSPAPLAENQRPMLLPCARVYPDETGAVRIALPQGEPTIKRCGGCTILRRLRREVHMSGRPDLVWHLMRKVDGSTPVSAILAGLQPEDRSEGTQLLHVLAAAGALDISGRPIGSFIHSATKKGVLPAGGLEREQIFELATNAGYRSYAGAPKIPLEPSVPEALQGFHDLTRRRRSQRDYSGASVHRSELEAILDTACGTTGAKGRADRTATLRAYPSSGALYAVEIYPVVLRVEDLDLAVYHYQPIENVLEIVRAVTDQSTIIDAMLPMERQMVRGAAALICLTGNFTRHESKYGEGGYRMLIAEAGHISQNLILAATALGIAARPFGGVFDGLLNEALGFDETDEQFLLSVLIGRAGQTSQS